MKNLIPDLEEIIRDLGLYEEFRLFKIRRDFEKILPPPLSDHVYPSFLKNGLNFTYVYQTEKSTSISKTIWKTLRKERTKILCSDNSISSG